MGELSEEEGVGFGFGYRRGFEEGDGFEKGSGRH